MAFLIKTDQTIKPVKPNDSKHFSFAELYELIGCNLVQLIKLPDNYYMVIDESGALRKDKIKNEFATEMYQQFYKPKSKEVLKKEYDELVSMGFIIHTIEGNEENFIYGNVVVCKRSQID